MSRRGFFASILGAAVLPFMPKPKVDLSTIRIDLSARIAWNKEQIRDERILRAWRQGIQNARSLKESMREVEV